MHRKAYVDWARGIAVVLMIWAHTTDAWTKLTVRRAVSFRDATVLGGFAAPLFLWLAGFAVVLAATRNAQRTGSRREAVEAICRRGLEIFILGFLFRVQGFVVTPGSHPVTLFRVDILNIMGPAVVAAGIVWGVARTTTARVVAYSAITTALAMATPIVREAAFVDALPLWFQWYLRPAGEFTIFTVFPWTGFVFAGGAVGALVAASTNDRRERQLQATLAVVGIALVIVGFHTAGRPSIYRSSSFWTTSPTWFAIRLGILMIALSAIYLGEVVLTAFKARASRHAALKGCATSGERGPHMPGVAQVPGMAHGPGMAQGLGAAQGSGVAQGPGVAQGSGVAYGPRVAQGFSPAVGLLERLGRNSLFVYWIHVELVYGYASWGWRHRLPLWGSAIGFVLFTALMYRAIGWRDLIVAKWRGPLFQEQAQPRLAAMV